MQVLPIMPAAGQMCQHAGQYDVAGSDKAADPKYPTFMEGVKDGPVWGVTGQCTKYRSR